VELDRRIKTQEDDGGDDDDEKNFPCSQPRLADSSDRDEVVAAAAAAAVAAEATWVETTATAGGVAHAEDRCQTE